VLDYEQFTPLIKIQNKQGELVSFVANEAQRLYRRQAGTRNIVLKARQEGLSTEIEARIFHRACTREGYRAAIIAHERKATGRLKARIDLMYANLPVKPIAKYDSTSELVFHGMRSTIYTGTAGGRGFGRGDTLSQAHCSEFAFWPNPMMILNGLQEAVPAEGQIDVESTPNGYNDFYQLCKSAMVGEVPYRLIFIPWFVHGEYKQAPGVPVNEWSDEEKVAAQKAEKYGVKLSPEQVAWRRGKAATLKEDFAQEYPEDPQTCFLVSGRPRFDNKALNALIPKARKPIETTQIADSLLTLRVWEQPRAGEFYVIGADSSEGKSAGDYDSSDVLEWKSGRKVADLHGKAALHKYADELSLLGMRYNAAVLAVENKHPGPAVIARLEERRYPKLFHHEGVKEAGFDTNTYWRPQLIDCLDEAIGSAPETFIDEEEIGELMSFVINSQGHSEASTGAHDDRVMGRGIAQFVRTLVKPPASGRPAQQGRRTLGEQV
jgi:hypothetical protein